MKRTFTLDGKLCDVTTGLSSMDGADVLLVVIVALLSLLALILFLLFKNCLHSVVQWSTLKKFCVMDCNKETTM